MRVPGFFLNVILCLSLGFGTALAQVTTGTILGTVADSSGAVIPSASISIKNVDTGMSRALTTDALGRYTAPLLPLGNYEISATGSGFQTEVHRGIVLTVGREAVVDFALQVGAVTTTVEVSGEAPLVESTSATVAGVVNERAMRDLPLNGRSIADLTVIQPGVVSNIGVVANVFSGGPRISINGARAQQSLYLLDGAEIVAPYENVTPVSVMNQLLGVDTIREFSVLTNNYGAQYGRAVGGIVNSVTRSGTNHFHGSAFEFLRNSVMDAKNFYDRADEPIPPFKRNQFGATLGGPLLKDKAFFFLSYEGLRQRLGVSDVGFVPTLEARTQGVLRDVSGNVTSTVRINPDIVPLLDILVLPNLSTPVGGGLGEFRSFRTQSGQEDYGMVRGDVQLGTNDSLFGRFTIDDSGTTIPQYYTMPGGLTTVDDGGYRFAALSETRLFSPTLLNTVTLGFARNTVGQNDILDEAGLDPRLSVVPGSPLMSANMAWMNYPGTRFNGSSIVGHNLNNPLRFTDNTYEVSDNVTYTKGRHSWVVGFNLKRYQMNEVLSTWAHGNLVFPNITALLTGTPSVETSLTGSADTYRGWRQTYTSLYVQDAFKVWPNLTLNLGLRWERVTNPSEVNGKISILEHPLTSATFTQPDKLFQLRDGWKGLAPRFGLAWTPFSKTVLRSGFGVFREIPLEYMYQLTLFVPPFATRVQITNPPFPFPLRATTSTSGEPLIIDPRLKYPYNYQWNFGVEHQLSNSIVVKATYIGTRGLSLPAINNPNQPIPQRVNDRWFTPGTGTVASAPVPNPNFSSLRYTANLGDSYYHALQLTGEKRFSSGLQLTTSYTWSKNIDSVPIGLKGAETTSANTSAYNVFNTYDLKAEKGLSQLDARHNFVFSYNYELPFGAGKALGGQLTGIAQHVLGGWRINGILSARSGLPTTAALSFNNARNRNSNIVDRPDLLPGKSNNPVLGGPNRYFDTSSFTVPPPGFFGNTARDTIIQAGLVNVDFSIFKDITITEGQRVEFRAEFFNLPNRPNFGGVNPVVFTSAAGAVSPTAGRITSTATTSRQVQVALKYVF